MKYWCIFTCGFHWLFQCIWNLFYVECLLSSKAISIACFMFYWSHCPVSFYTLWFFWKLNMLDHIYSTLDTNLLFLSAEHTVWFIYLCFMVCLDNTKQDILAPVCSSLEGAQTLKENCSGSRVPRVSFWHPVCYWCKVDHLWTSTRYWLLDLLFRQCLSVQIAAHCDPLCKGTPSDQPLRISLIREVLLLTVLFSVYN